ncbi:MAG: hypothetical protein ACRD9L_22820, partial [Bryobacteraceae bacterium]
MMETDLLALSENITRHPEIGFEERRSVALLTEYLRQHGFANCIPASLVSRRRLSLAMNSIKLLPG